MENIRLMRVAGLTLFGIAVAMSNASAQNANANPAAAAANNNGNGAAPERPLPPKGPRALFNEDGTPAGDKAAGNAIDSSLLLPDTAADKPKEKRLHKHKLSRGPVDLNKSDYRSNPLPQINVKR